MATSAFIDAERPFLIELDAFSGPLDLLLHLIREQEIDIADIPIARIADQFLDVIETLGLNEAASYLEMAAWLLRIKIQILLPRPFDDEDWEDPRAQLVRRLLEYEQIREVARWLEDRADIRSAQFSHGCLPELPQPSPAPIELQINEILEAVDRVIEGIPRRVLHRVVPRPLDVEGATERILAMIEERGKLEFAELFDSRSTVTDVLSALVAILELARRGRLSLRQRKPFGKMGISDGQSVTTG